MSKPTHSRALRARFREWLVVAVVLLGLLGVGGFLGAASGLVPIRASSGHFAVTEWFLQFSKRRSVSTHTLGAEPLSLEAPWLVLKGAGHFETGCRPCHGAPDLERLPRIMRAALPPPPPLEANAPSWQPEELFYLVKHGIKLTGMPAWPSQVRDDEVLAVVAFLRELPDLDADRYRELVHGRAELESEADPLSDLAAAEPPPLAVSLGCTRCHGRGGAGRGSAAFPKIGGQRRDYLAQALDAYADGARPSGIMEPIAAGLNRKQIDELADYYARQTWNARPDRWRELVAGAEVTRGREIAERGVPERKVPACSECHGVEPGEKSAEVPMLGGQYADYLVLQLELFARGVRGGSKRAHLMAEVAPRMTAADMRDVAEYYEQRAR